MFKLVAVDDGAGAWTPAIKRSDSPVKVLNPGAKRLWRVYDDRGRATADVLSTADRGARGRGRCTCTTTPGPTCARDGRRSARSTSCSCRSSTAARRRSVAPTTSTPRRPPAASPTSTRLDPGVRRLVNPHTYHVSITDDLFDLKQQLLATLH